MWPFRKKEKTVTIPGEQIYVPERVVRIPEHVIAMPNRTFRIPEVGEVVWWATKQIECVVDAVTSDGILFHFTGGPVIQRKRDGHYSPRWAVTARSEDATYDEAAKTWIVGQGATPKVVRGQVIKPEPIVARAHG